MYTYTLPLIDCIDCIYLLLLFVLVRDHFDQINDSKKFPCVVQDISYFCSGSKVTLVIFLAMSSYIAKSFYFQTWRHVFLIFSSDVTLFRQWDGSEIGLHTCRQYFMYFLKIIILVCCQKGVLKVFFKQLKVQIPRVHPTSSTFENFHCIISKV